MKGITIMLSGSCLVALLRTSAQEADRKAEYVHAVVRGAGFMPWQEQGASAEEQAFRRQIEARKDRMLATRAPVRHPVSLTEEELSQARANIQSTSWAKGWFTTQQRIADHVVAQPDRAIDDWIPELTPWYCYGMTCPSCVGKKSQEAMGSRVMQWSEKEPDLLRCRTCGQTYPDPAYPETATLACPRSGQALTFYLNDRERQDREDRSGRRAWHWVGRPTHVSFLGQIRVNKVSFMIRAARSLALLYRFDGDPRYAEKTVAILLRLAHCYRTWLYHDYWDTVADCDPMYAAWHDQSLRLEWKKHLCTDAYKKDSVDKAAMLRGYWGAGRLHPSCDVAGSLVGLSQAYDLVHDAKGADGGPLWTPESRAKVERDLFMEWLMGGEPFLGGAGKATNVNNKSGRVYNPMAHVAKCLGITAWADTALAGFESLEAQSLAYDGFSHESPAYTFSGASYLGNMLGLAEALHGFRWPDGYPRRSGVVDLYRQSGRFRLLMQAQVDCLRPDGVMPPLSDTPTTYTPNRRFLEVGLKRLPEFYGSAFATVYPGGDPSEYAILHLDATELTRSRTKGEGAALPELYFPAWMTAILRHGSGPEAAMLTLHLSPHGGHRHADNLSVYYRTGGQTLLGDHGYIGDTPMNKWFHHTFSHNLVIVDDQPQRMRQPLRRPRLHHMAVTPRVSVVEASSDAYEQCTEYRRLTALVKGPNGRTFAVDLFRVAGGKRHTFRVFSELAASDAEAGRLEFEGLELPPEPSLPQVGTSTRNEDIFGLRDVRRTDDVPASWRAIWKQKGAAYRLWMLTEVDAVEAANGPGQETPREPGRRVRVLDAIREGADLATVFVALHEPGSADGSMPVRHAARLVPPAEAGPEAVALRIESAWGRLWVFSGFASEVELEGIRFQGDIGVFCQGDGATCWLLGVGAPSLCREQVGFRAKTASWRSDVVRNTSSVITAASPRAPDWPAHIQGCESYVLAHDGEYRTGFPVETTGPDTVTVRRFPLPELQAFELPALRYLSVEELR